MKKSKYFIVVLILIINFNFFSQNEQDTSIIKDLNELFENSDFNYEKSTYSVPENFVSYFDNTWNEIYNIKNVTNNSDSLQIIIEIECFEKHEGELIHVLRQKKFIFNDKIKFIHQRNEYHINGIYQYNDIFIKVVDENSISVMNCNKNSLDAIATKDDLNTKYEIYSISGQKVKFGTTEKNKNIDISDLNSGVYICSLMNKFDFILCSYKFIKN